MVSLELGDGGRFRTDAASDGDQDGALRAVVQDRLAVPVDESEIVVLGEGHDGSRVDVERLLERGRKVDAPETKETVRFTPRLEGKRTTHELKVATAFSGSAFWPHHLRQISRSLG